MDAVSTFLVVLAALVWAGCGLTAYHSFLADVFALIGDVAGGEAEAKPHYERWKSSRNMPFVFIFFLATGALSLLVVVLATRGFRTGFRK